ncbi:MAG: acyl-CoA dehydrogenase family protein [bacterium]
MIQRAGGILGDQGPKAAYSAIHEAKYAAAEASSLITERALKVVGGPGLLREHPLERHHRDAWAGLVMPPNSETCLENVAKSALPVEAGGLMT